MKDIYITTLERESEIVENTRNAWQSLAYSPLGAIVSPPSEYLRKTLTY